MKIKIAVTLIVLFLVSFQGYINVKNLGEGTNEKGKTAVNQEAVSAVNSVEKDEESIRKLLQDFTDAAKEKNKDDILQYFALNEYIEGYNLEMMKKDFSDMAKKPTYEERLLNMEKKYNLFLLGFTLTEDELEEIELELDDVIKRLQQLELNELSIQRIDTPNEEQTKTEVFEKMIRNRCMRYGAESIAYRTILYHCGENTYYCGFELFKYNGTWKINELRASVTSVDANIVTIPCSEKEYLEIIEIN
jgi:hypothetical protein